MWLHKYPLLLESILVLKRGSEERPGKKDDRFDRINSNTETSRFKHICFIERDEQRYAAKDLVGKS